MGNEVELKLEIAADAFATLEQSGLLGPSADDALLHAIYFDTPDRHLRRHAITLRIRREGKRLIQAVKSAKGASAGLFERGEWEFPVQKWRPVLDGRTPALHALGDAQDTLAAQFDLVVHRNRFIITQDETTVEVALDRGTARVMDRSTAFCEVELELLSGNPAALFALARRIDAVAPVHIGTLGKSERGFRLLGPVKRAEKSGNIPLLASHSPDVACAQVFAACLKQYRLNESILLQRREPEAVHQARVALRRLRTARTVFAELLGPDRQSRKLDTRLRSLGREYGKVRDLDVLIERTVDPATRAVLIAKRDRAYRHLTVVLGAPATRHLMLDLSEWIALGPWRTAEFNAAQRATTLATFAGHALNKRLSRVRKRGHHLASLPETARHELRKDVKKLRYAVEFFAALHAPPPAAKRRTKFIAALSDLQHHLGVLNDIHFEQEALGADRPDRSAEQEYHLKRASDARHALLDCKPFWE